MIKNFKYRYAKQGIKALIPIPRVQSKLDVYPPNFKICIINFYKIEIVLNLFF